MKYTLFITARLLSTFGPDPGLRYDIMCAFIKTLHNSVLLGDKVKKSWLIGVVLAFHSHAHNRKCQVCWHPMYINGVGTEDFEECERTFYGSNNLANVTCLATPFHWRQEIQEYFHFHDEDKHTNIGKEFALDQYFRIDCIVLQAASYSAIITMPLTTYSMVNLS
jgi:hypothetical protein